MKKILCLFVALALITSSYAAVVLPGKKESTVKPKLNAADVLIPIGKNGETISLIQLSEIKVKDLEVLTGNKMNLADKIGFKFAQKQLRNSINADGTFSNRKLEKIAARAEDGSGFHLGGFALGFLLGLIGVLIAYLIKDDKKSSRTKWAWIGFGVGLLLWLIVFVI